MTFNPISKYMIGVGYNVALGSLTNIEKISVSGHDFFAPKAFGHYNPGQFSRRTDGIGYYGGFNSVRWVFMAMTHSQYNYLRNVYCAGGYSGLVTIYTTLGQDDNIYARMNAVLDIPPTEGLGDFFAFANPPISLLFSRLAAAS